MKRYVSIMAAVVAVGLTVTLTGCSSGGRGYATPTKTCGIPVKKDALLPLLPDGENVGEESAGSVTSDRGCDVIVDERVVLSVYEAYVDKLYDPMADLESYKFKHRKPIQRLPFAGKGAVGHTNAMISTKCGGPKVKYLLVDIDVDKAVNSDVKQRRKDMERFVEAYVPNAQKKLKCTA
ncbi:MAG: hypothetical protein ACRDP3_13825 [Streptomyces sp.]|uniref:hypothetical protein n=1 Tax=Streptomyces sp. TaxID=1931 RepID=UPI003D6BCF7C